MIRLTCSVHGCHAPLERVGESLRCVRGHAFDVARSGYCNLLQPQDRRSTLPGDAPEAIEARRRWLARGLGDPLVGAIDECIGSLALPPEAVVVDVGCGDGFVLDALARRRRFDACGIDLAAGAVRAAARRLPRATWLVANADRRLPLQDASVDLILSLFGPRNGPEFSRVLREGAHVVAAVPGDDDLIELREAVLGRGLSVERVEGLMAALAPFFGFVSRRGVKHRAALDAPAIRDALAMTYRGARPRERERADALASLDVTLSAELLVFRRA